jgi:hypothetical protein
MLTLAVARLYFLRTIDNTHPPLLRRMKELVDRWKIVIVIVAAP